MGQREAIATIDAHEPGGVCEAIDAAPSPAEDTASVELASTAEGATTAKPEALGPGAGGKLGMCASVGTNVERKASHGRREGAS